MILTLGGKKPDIGRNCFIAPDAWTIGDVVLGDEVTIMFGAVLRGDILPIRIGSRTNIQEHSLLHTSNGRTPTIVGEEVTVGHRAIIHGAKVGNRCLIGMGSIILDEAVIEDECVIGAGSVVTEGKRIPARSLVLGVPGKVIRSLSDDEVAFLSRSAEGYVRTGKLFSDALPSTEK